MHKKTHFLVHEILLMHKKTHFLVHEGAKDRKFKGTF